MFKTLIINMGKRFSSNSGTGLRVSLWPTALVGIVVIKAVLSLNVTPGSFLLSYSGISYFLLLFLATSFAIRNGIRKTAGTRAFWMSLAIAYGLWTLDQYLMLYYELVRHIAVPDGSIADPLLFLHIVPLMAAVASLPHQSSTSGRKLYSTILNSLLLLFFWSFLYGYLVFPYQYFPTAAGYALRFDVLYLLENLALLLVVGVLTLRAQPPWRSIYLHLLGASTLYALSSTVANLAIDSGGYINGKLYGLGLTASVCWFVWIPLRARQIEGEATAIQSDSGQSSRGSAWAMLVVVAVPIPIIWELFKRNENVGLPTFRLLVAIIAILCLASAAFIKEYLARREMDFHFNLANDRLRLAMEAGASVGWDLDVKSGRNVWFGDLRIFGIDSDTYVTTGSEFTRLLHPEDRTRVSEAIADARQSKKPYAAEFRVLQPDGTVRWLGARGKFYYARNGNPERMLGVSVDITKSKLAEEAVSSMNRRVIEAEERERDRIAKDLHENIGQRLALLAIAIEQLKRDLPDQAVEFLDSMDAVWRKTLGILTDVKASAHELYSPRLEYLGIAAVMKTFCEEFSERKSVEIDFRSQGFSSPVLPDVSICLFRVLQEALHNGVMHSGVQKFSVKLWGESDEIRLRVSDAGVGFDLGAARGGRGLGLVRIEQRIKLVEGTSWIDSQPEKGTTVQVSVPMHSERVFLRAAG
ncbi:PAS domain-containing protein [Granulicella sp. L46]|jgi:PAS domain S-box-containing protein|uniref:sensor histidine kinase n=1 Tax=Granulicella sp. L46 TaxID=1641865 RepID=UPI00131C0C11|nr:PAS domain-containing protein [Granulicella sp. L46]